MREHGNAGYAADRADTVAGAAAVVDVDPARPTSIPTVSSPIPSTRGFFPVATTTAAPRASESSGVTTASRAPVEPLPHGGRATA
jgi:hypothetical protein